MATAIETAAEEKYLLLNKVHDVFFLDLSQYILFSGLHNYTSYEICTL